MPAPAAANGNSWGPQVRATGKGFARVAQTLIAAGKVIHRAHGRL